MGAASVTSIELVPIQDTVAGRPTLDAKERD